MARCIFENLSPDQAKLFAHWYEGQGENNADIWFEENDLKTPFAHVSRKGGFMEVLDNGDVVVYCRDSL